MLRRFVLSAHALLLLLPPSSSSAWVMSPISAAAAAAAASRRPTRTTKRCFAVSDGSSSWETALAVVPPDEAWDRLQRARHVAMDPSNKIWPPAIRLFHPFVLGNNDDDLLYTTALQIAEIVEKYQIEPFQVTLSEWSIVPHVEAMEPQSDAITGENGRRANDDDAEMEKVQALIAREERIGREKFLRRQTRRKQKLREQQQGIIDNDDEPPLAAIIDNDATATMQEFNGPCVIVLEPDAVSKERLQAVRHILKQELAPNSNAYANDYSLSASSSATTTATSLSSRRKNNKDKRRRQSSDNNDNNDGDDDLPTDFRPVVPIGSFPTVSSAIPVARKLRNLWEPLTFNVTDLHLLSSSYRRLSENLAGFQQQEEQVDGLLQEYYGRYNFQKQESSSSSSSGHHHQRETIEEELHFWSESATCGNNNNQFGCDALVSLIGEEVEMDQELNQEMANLVFEKGEAGGYYEQQRLKEEGGGDGDDTNATVKATKQRQDVVRTKQGEANNGSDDYYADGDDDDMSLNPALEQWLFEEDEEHDEGMVVVIGRTQFFTGEMREYVGMPACSALDARRDSGAARRRRRRQRGSAQRRSVKRFKDGDWGCKQEIDYLIP